MQADGVVAVGEQDHHRSNADAADSAAMLRDEIEAEDQGVEQWRRAAASYFHQSGHGVGSPAATRTQNDGPHSAERYNRQVVVRNRLLLRNQMQNIAHRSSHPRRYRFAQVNEHNQIERG